MDKNVVGKFKNMFDFWGEDFFQSPAGFGTDVSISCGDVAETNFFRDWGDVSATSHSGPDRDESAPKLYII